LPARDWCFTYRAFPKEELVVAIGRAKGLRKIIGRDCQLAAAAKVAAVNALGLCVHTTRCAMILGWCRSKALLLALVRVSNDDLAAIAYS